MNAQGNGTRLGEAKRLAREIGDRAVFGQRGAILPAPVPTGDPISARKPRPLSPHFHSGVTGVAFFLAALGHVGDGKERELALALLSPPRRQLRKILDDPDRAARAPFRLGAMIGLGGYLYSFLRIGRWLDEPLLIEEAHRISALITVERIRTDRALDLAHGCAGALLALLHLHRMAPDPNSNGDSPLRLARTCAEHLLQQRVAPEGSPRAWLWEYGETPLCGFSHGASGICCALLRLHRVTGAPELLAAAREGMAYERRHYAPEVGEWRDLRDTEHRRFKTAWCHGSPGIALTRLEALETLRVSEPTSSDRTGGEPSNELREQVREDLDRALAATRSPELDPLDHLCCGNAGRVEVLIAAAGQLSHAPLRHEAHELVRKARTRAEESTSQYRWSEDDPEVFRPGFMVGAAGLGYTLLRLETADRLPCALALR